jgi:predicted RNA-binding protein with TRAM domain
MESFGRRRFGGGGGGGGGSRYGGGRKRDFGYSQDKPVKEGETYDVEIIEVGSKGDGIAKIQNFVIFVPGVQKGQKVKIRITQVRSSSAVGEVVSEGSSETISVEGSSEEEAEQETEEAAHDHTGDAEEEPKEDLDKEPVED